MLALTLTLAQVVAPATPPKVYDPYGARSYTQFRAQVNRVGGRGVLYVGVEDKSVGTYECHFRVPSGWCGFADGVYDCWHDAAKCEPVMDLRRPKPAPPPTVYWPAVTVRQFTGGS